MINALDHGVRGDGLTDDAPAIRTLLNNEKTVYLPHPPVGYLVRSGLEIQPYGQLLGPFAGMWQMGRVVGPKPIPAGIACLHVRHPDGPAVKLNSSSQLCGVGMAWPEQATDSEPSSYPPAVEMAGATPSVRNVCLLNPYVGIICKAGCPTIENVTGQPLSLGVELDECWDTARLNNFHFANQWTNSHWTPEGGASALQTWVRENATALLVRGVDALWVSRFFAFLYRYGILFQGSLTPDPSRASSGAYGSVVNSSLDGCQVGVRIEKVDVIRLANMHFSTFADPLLEIDAPDSGPVSLADCTFQGNARHVIVRNGNLVLNGNQFIGQPSQAGGFHVDVEAGQVRAGHNVFEDGGLAMRLGKDVLEADVQQQGITVTDLRGEPINGGANGGPPGDYAVGPGQYYENLRDVPFNDLQPGDRVLVHWRAEPYRDKIQLSCVGTPEAPITIEGVPGPNGELPELNAEGSVEGLSNYWTDQVSAQAIITVAPWGSGPKPANLVLRNLRLHGARRDRPFTRSDGREGWWNWGAAGVALYRCENVTIQGCIIHDNENGIFGKSEGHAAGDLRRIVVRGNTIYGNGVPGQDHYHNTYIEGIGTLYEFNDYGPPAEGSGGLNLKDRSAGAIIRYNWIEGGQRLLDLVDPDNGAPSFLADSLWGKTWVYGNLLLNPRWGGATSLVQFGFDEEASAAQRLLYFAYNTVVNTSVRDADGRWKTAIFKLTGGSRVMCVNNILHSWSPEPGIWSGDWYLAFTAYGGGTVILGKNWAAEWLNLSSEELVTSNAEQLMLGSDPGFVDLAGGDYRLATGSPCIGAAQSLRGNRPLSTPRWGWTLTGWAERAMAANLGAVE